MKKSLFMLFLACVAGVPSHAQKVSDGKLESRYNITVPHEFLYGNEPVLLLQAGSELRTVNVYDENIDLVKSIDLKDLNFNYQLVYKIEEREAKDATLVDSDPVREYSSYEAFVQSEMNVNPTFTEKCLKIEKLENGDRKITFDYSKYNEPEIESRYFHYEFFGEKYPLVYLIEHEGKVTLYYNRYEINMTDWVDKGEEIENLDYSLHPISLYNFNLNTNIQDSRTIFNLSQTLFNDDDKFEYIVPKVKLTSENNSSNLGTTGPITGTEGGQIETSRKTLISKDSNVAVVGFQVVSETGSILQDVEFDTFTGNISIMDGAVITIGKNTYLAFCANDAENHSKTVFYKIDRLASAVTKVESVSGSLKIFPTLVDKGNVIHVDFGKAAKNESEISVFSSSGAKIKSMKIPAGQNAAQFVLDAPAGMYIVNKTSLKGTPESRKIIIK